MCLSLLSRVHQLGACQQSGDMCVAATWLRHHARCMINLCMHLVHAGDHGRGHDCHVHDIYGSVQPEKGACAWQPCPLPTCERCVCDIDLVPEKGACAPKKVLCAACRVSYSAYIMLDTHAQPLRRVFLSASPPSHVHACMHALWCGPVHS